MTATRLEKILLMACILLAFGWVAADSLVFHPGFTRGDESGAVGRVEAALEGLTPTWRATGGFINNLVITGASALAGRSPAALQLAGLIAIFVESLLFAAWIRPRHGERVAVWAALVNLLCAFSLLRWRHLLSFTIMPAEMLALLATLGWAKGWRAAPWAFLACLFLFDYEGWMIGLPLVMATWLAAHRGQRQAGFWTGAAAGLAVVGGLSAGAAQSYWMIRNAQTAPLGWAAACSGALSQIGQFFTGSATAFISSFARHPSFPVLFLPALLLGCWIAWRRDRVALACALVGLLPLGLRSTGFEPHRALAAWPYLCLLGGLGASAILEGAGRLKAWLPVLLSVGLVLGSGWLEGSAYLRGMRDNYWSAYGASRAYLDAGRFLKGIAWKGSLLDDFDAHGEHLVTFLAGGPSAGKETVAVIPAAFAPCLGPAWGTLKVFPAGGGAPPVLLLFPSSKFLPRLREINSSLAALRPVLREWLPLRRRSLLLDYLAAHPRLDPWVETVCWESIVGAGFYAGDIREDLLAAALRRPLQSASLLVEIAYYGSSARPEYGLPLLRRALAMDTHRLMAWGLYFDLLQRLGLSAEAGQARRSFAALPAGWAWQGFY